jgi:hypothetical protein
MMAMHNVLKHNHTLKCHTHQQENDRSCFAGASASATSGSGKKLLADGGTHILIWIPS